MFLFTLFIREKQTYACYTLLLPNWEDFLQIFTENYGTRSSFPGRNLTFQHIPTAAENGAFRILFVVAEKPTFSLVSVMRLVVCDVWCRSTAFCTEKTWKSCYTWDFESKLKCNKSQFLNEQCSKPAISPLYTGWLAGIPIMDIVQPRIYPYDNQQTKGLEPSKGP